MTKRGDNVGCEEKAMVAFYPDHSLHDPTLALYDRSRQLIVRHAAGHNK
jgi:hypothetical protein